MVELDPGKTAWPFHFHRANEEAIYVLAGVGTLRLGSERLRVRTGDYVAMPIGADHAHQLTNTGSEVLRYLVVSTMVTPDVCVYPDSGKVGVIDGLDDDEGGVRRVVTFPRGAEVDYWEGETTTLDGNGDEATPEERAAAIDERGEADLEALRQKLKRGDDPPEERAEDELDALKRVLDDGS